MLHSPPWYRNHGEAVEDTASHRACCTADYEAPLCFCTWSSSAAQPVRNTFVAVRLAKESFLAMTRLQERERNDSLAAHWKSKHGCLSLLDLVSNSVVFIIAHGFLLSITDLCELVQR